MVTRFDIKVVDNTFHEMFNEEGNNKYGMDCCCPTPTPTPTGLDDCCEEASIDVTFDNSTIDCGVAFPDCTDIQGNTYTLSYNAGLSGGGNCAWSWNWLGGSGVEVVVFLSDNGNGTWRVRIWAGIEIVIPNLLAFCYHYDGNHPAGCNNVFPLSGLNSIYGSGDCGDTDSVGGLSGPISGYGGSSDIDWT